MKEEQIMILCRAIDEYGEESQKRMAVEECAELINVLAKESRGRIGTVDIITEIADVTIMMEQLAMIYGYEKVRDEINRKVERLNQRLKKK